VNLLGRDGLLEHEVNAALEKEPLEFLVFCVCCENDKERVRQFHFGVLPRYLLVECLDFGHYLESVLDGHLEVKQQSIDWAGEFVTCVKELLDPIDYLLAIHIELCALNESSFFEIHLQDLQVNSLVVSYQHLQDSVFFEFFFDFFLE